jgi:uncharacterized protein
MQQIDERLLLSASDLINFLECEHLTYLDLEIAAGRLSIEPTRSDTSNLVARKGQEHEAAYLETLRAEGSEIVEIESVKGLEGITRAAAQTAEALRGGAEIVYQGVLFDGEKWLGYADFLERVDTPSSLGAFSYEVADTKLAQRVKPYFLIQLCLYSELLSAIQGADPEWISVILGRHTRERFRLADFLSYYRSVRRHFEAKLNDGLGETYPDRVSHCDLCEWDGHCSARREEDDHLSLVANIRRTQIVRLEERGISEVARLAVANPDERPVRIEPHTFDTLRSQAKLQVEQRESGKPCYELLTPEPERGFARLPAPSPGDVYFDMEGDPFFEDGLEYLFGVVTADGEESEFRAFWALDRAEEKVAFEAFIQFVMDRLERWPDLHVYHYAAYEATALKKLMGLHGTCENEVDHLLRSKILVDLYAVVRQGLRVGEPAYSIKNIEHFYMAERDTDVLGGGDATVAFEEYLDGGTQSLLESIERYNEDDCRSTLLLHRWLLKRRKEATETFKEEIPWRLPPVVDEPDPEDQAALDELKTALAGDVPEDPDDRDTDQQSRWLLAQLLDYHRREAKPAWWAYFERLEADDEQLIELDNEALGGLEPTGDDPVILPVPSRSMTYRLKFPSQDHKVSEGSYVDPATETGVNVDWIDDEGCVLEIRRETRAAHLPLPRALIPGRPYKTDDQKAALRRFASDVVARGLEAGGAYTSLRSVLCRELPRSSGASPGDALQHDEFNLGEAKRLVRGLERSHLFIQGPPGSGKTYSGAQLILDLLDEGARVGVAAQSHAAIHNLLHEIERFAPEHKPFTGVKRGDSYESEVEEPLIRMAKDLGECLDPNTRLVAGTAWLFSREMMETSLDYLFIDEAGQISLADGLAMATSARNLVLLGDPNQLAQVSQAVHPPGAGASILEHLLGDETTIPAERGLFIDKSRRMHPDVCHFISEAIYEGRLESLDECENQRIEAPGRLTGTGVRFFPVQHDGNARQSPEEATVVRDLVQELLSGRYTRADNHTMDLEESEIMIVAPYNAQVRCLRHHLSDGVRIGTVDKFQGQEAAVCFFSMATSSGAEIPRNLEFLFSRNRLNVAVSRARCLAVLVCSPELLHIRCRSAEEMRLVNALCKLVELSPRLTNDPPGAATSPSLSRS